MSIDPETVAKVARLAHIHMSEEELEGYAPQLSNIINWVEQLGEVDTDGVEPLANVSEITLKMREDAVTDGGYQEDVLANAPETLEGFYVVPKIIESGE